MSQNDIVQFERQWKLFVTKLGLQMHKRSCAGIPSGVQLNAILKDCVLDWTSGETTCGRWLMNLEEQEPEKAEIIAGILLEDMCFREEPVKKGVPGVLKATVPVAGAIAGLVLSWYNGANAVVQLLSTATPAVMLAPAMKVVDDQICRTNAEAGIQAYLQQLELYKTSVLGILQQ